MLLIWCTLAKRRKTLESQMQTSIANMCWRIIQKLIQLFQVCKMSPPHKYARHLSSMCHGQLWSFSLAIGTLSWTRCTLREIYVILSENFIWATSKKFYVECIFPLKSFTLLKMFKATIRKAKQFVLHHAVCKTPFVLSLKTIISLRLKACASVCDSFRNCKTVKRAKMPKWNIYILYQNIDAYFDGLCVIILPRIDSLLWARAENYFRWFIFLFNGVMRDILKFCT